MGTDDTTSSLCPKRTRKLHGSLQSVRSTGFSRKADIPPKGGTTNALVGTMRFPGTQAWLQSLVAILLVCLVASNLPADVPPKDGLPPFELPNTSEQVTTVAPSADATLTVVCFLGTECPLVKLYSRRLNGFCEQYADKGVRFFGVNSNTQDSMSEVREFAEKYDLKFPLLKDYDNKIADQFDARRTPEVFVLDDQFVVRYRGRIDDQYTPGQTANSASKEELKQAIEQLLAGDPVSVPETKASGCIIGRVAKKDPSVTSGKANEITYCDQVARILQNRCVECHRTGEIGPFVLDDFDEVTGWAEMVLEVIDEGRMPPWHANPEHGDFSNAREMPDEEKETLRKWFAAGMPYGDAGKLPPAKTWTDGWRLPREPDLVVAMGDNKFEVPADGIVDYQYFVVDPGFTEDKWVTAAEVIPGNRGVVHHSIVFVRPPDGVGLRGLGWIAAYVPGQQVAVYPPGAAQLVPAGSKLVFQQHYTPNGIAGDDMTRVGLLFADPADVTDEVYTVIGMDQQFEIPPNTPDHKVKVNFGWLPDGATMLSASPHMHLRGKSFRMWADIDGEKKTLLDVPNYDFNWQHAYHFREPIPMSAIKRMDFEVVFDNSDANPVNPNPDEVVTWGDQTYEEMAIAFCQVSQPRERVEQEDTGDAGDSEASEERDVNAEPADESSSSAKSEDEAKPVEPKLTPEQQKFVDEQTKRLMEKFDNSGDGKISMSETPWIFRRYTFRNIDRDGDGILTGAEVKEAARRRIQ